MKSRQFFLNRKYAVAAFSVFSSTSWIYATAQCTQQPPAGPYAVHPGATIYYSLDPSLSNIPPGSTPPPPISQIQEAFNAWSAANTQVGGDGVTFVLADANNPASVVVVADTTSVGPAAASVSANAGLISTTNPATMTFYPNSIIQNSTQPAYSATEAGYSSAYQQVALHEIGHLEGIGDYAPGTAPAPSPTTSVVAPTIGTNDTGNPYQKNGPTSCDVSQATSSSASIANAARSGGGGGNGGGGGGGTIGGGGGSTISGGGSNSCTWDDDTNTLTCDA